MISLSDRAYAHFQRRMEMTTQRAKYVITNVFVNAPRGVGFSNLDLLDEVSWTMDTPITLKTVQNVTAGLKSNGGLRSSRDGDGSLIYTRTSKAKVLNASEFIF